MKFLNPRTDYAFKKIFWSEWSKDILISFLNAILDFKWDSEIKEVDILDPYSAPKIEWLKETYLDVTVKTKWWKTIIIEMQVLNVKWFDKRVLYNVTKKYANQIESWESYLELNPVIWLTITDFEMFSKDEDINNKYISKYNFQERNSNKIYNWDLEMVFVELPKFTKSLEESTSIKDKWIYFMKNVDDMTVEPKSLKDEKAIDHAFQIANTIWLSKEELELLDKRAVFLQDRRWMIELATEKWIKKWIERWIEKWIEKWKLEALKLIIESWISEAEARKILNI